MADILTRIDRHNWDVEPEPVRRIVEAAADEIRRLRQEVVSHVVMAEMALDCWPWMAEADETEDEGAK